MCMYSPDLVSIKDISRVDRCVSLAPMTLILGNSPPAHFQLSIVRCKGASEMFVSLESNTFSRGEMADQPCTNDTLDRRQVSKILVPALTTEGMGAFLILLCLLLPDILFLGSLLACFLLLLCTFLSLSCLCHTRRSSTWTNKQYPFIFSWALSSDLFDTFALGRTKRRCSVALGRINQIVLMCI